MKHIEKVDEPRELVEWRTMEKVNLTYKYMPKNAVRLSLLTEQGYICCYTGRRIELNSSHIEHFKPQSISLSEGKPEETVNYRNLHAAYPSDEYEKKYGKCPYGAHHREDRYDSKLLISPLDKVCESYFQFDKQGSISPRNSNDEKACYTIELLDLDHKELRAIRKEAITGALYALSSKLHDVGKMKKEAEKFLNRDKHGKFRPFCFVIQQFVQPLIIKAQEIGKAQQRKNKLKNKR